MSLYRVEFEREQPARKRVVESFQSFRCAMRRAEGLLRERLGISRCRIVRTADERELKRWAREVAV